MLQRHTGRHHARGPDAAHPVPRQGRQLRHARWSRAGSTRDTSSELADLLDTYGMAGDLRRPEIPGPGGDRPPTRRTSSTVVADFIASLPAEEVYHAAQERGFTWGAVRAGRGAARRPHLTTVASGRRSSIRSSAAAFVYPGEAAIFNGSPWRISCRAPLVGEHNVEILCGELGLSRAELALFAEQQVI